MFKSRGLLKTSNVPPSYVFHCFILVLRIWGVYINVYYHGRSAVVRVAMHVQKAGLPIKKHPVFESISFTNGIKILN